MGSTDVDLGPKHLDDNAIDDYELHCAILQVAIDMKYQSYNDLVRRLIIQKSENDALRVELARLKSILLVYRRVFIDRAGDSSWASDQE